MPKLSAVKTPTKIKLDNANCKFKTRAEKARCALSAENQTRTLIQKETILMSLFVSRDVPY